MGVSRGCRASTAQPGLALGTRWQRGHRGTGAGRGPARQTTQDTCPPSVPTPGPPAQHRGGMGLCPGHPQNLAPTAVPPEGCGNGGLAPRQPPGRHRVGFKRGRSCGFPVPRAAPGLGGGSGELECGAGSGPRLGELPRADPSNGPSSWGDPDARNSPVPGPAEPLGRGTGSQRNNPRDGPTPGGPCFPMVTPIPGCPG